MDIRRVRQLDRPNLVNVSQLYTRRSRYNGWIRNNYIKSPGKWNMPGCYFNQNPDNKHGTSGWYHISCSYISLSKFRYRYFNFKRLYRYYNQVGIFNQWWRNLEPHHK